MVLDTVAERIYVPFAADGLGAQDRVHERLHVLRQLVGGNDTLPIGACTFPVLSTRNSILPALISRIALADVHRDRAGLRVRHQAAGTEDPAQLAQLAHDVGRRDDHVALEPPFLDLLDVLDADEIGAGRLRFPLPVALGDDEHPDRLAGAVGSTTVPRTIWSACRGSTPRLTATSTVSSNLANAAFHQPTRPRSGTPVRGPPFLCRAGTSFRRCAISPRPPRPWNAPYPDLRIAASRSLAFRSAILISAIFLTCALVTLPTLLRLGWALPFRARPP